MERNKVILNQKYRITYKDCHNDKKHEGKTVTVLNIDLNGDCELQFSNGRKTHYHCSYLEGLNN